MVTGRRQLVDDEEGDDASCEFRARCTILLQGMGWDVEGG